jgi:hypothetical protein
MKSGSPLDESAGLPEEEKRRKAIYDKYRNVPIWNDQAFSSR